MDSEARQHVIDCINTGIRLDGRKTTEYRTPIKVETGVTKNAEGSAKVTIGETEVIAGVKMMIDKPYPDKPDEGTIMVGAELLPLSNPDFELGPPGIQAIELARVVDRGIRESGAIDGKKLCIKEGEMVWIISVDICTINDAGNLFDASSLAAIAAIKDAVFPEHKDGVIDYKNLTDKKLPVSKTPLSVTVHKVGPHLIVDPTTEEEAVSDARLTVAVTEDGEICAMQKGGNEPLSTEDISNMIDLAKEKIEELRALLG
ncbi:exosome complex protein Rrp42 [Candidatus Woesearchaeota archaeon]|nr:MAG: exosome complex protein Rrp42 [Candidatus Woesearchaeota archaeon]